MSMKQELRRYLQSLAFELFRRGYVGNQLNQAMDDIGLDVEERVDADANTSLSDDFGTPSSVLDEYGYVKLPNAKLRLVIRLGMFGLVTLFPLLLYGLAFTWFSVGVDGQSNLPIFPSIKLVELYSTSVLHLLTALLLFALYWLQDYRAHKHSSFDPRRTLSAILYPYYVFLAISLPLLTQLSFLPTSISYLDSAVLTTGTLVRALIISLIFALSMFMLFFRLKTMQEPVVKILSVLIIFPQVLHLPVFTNVPSITWTYIVSEVTQSDGSVVVTGNGFSAIIFLEIFWIFLPFLLGIRVLWLQWKQDLSESILETWSLGSLFIVSSILIGQFGLTLTPYSSLSPYAITDAFENYGGEYLGYQVFSYSMFVWLSLFLIWTVAHTGIYFGRHDGKPSDATIKLFPKLAKLPIANVFGLLLTLALLALLMTTPAYQYHRSDSAFIMSTESGVAEGEMIYSITQGRLGSYFSIPSRGELDLTIIVPVSSDFSFILLYTAEGSSETYTMNKFLTFTSSIHRVYLLNAQLPQAGDFTLSFNLTVYAQADVDQRLGLQSLYEFTPSTPLNWYGLWIVVGIIFSVPYYTKREENG